MNLRLAALAACAALLAAPCPSWATSAFSLEDAFERVLASHPDLRRFDYERTSRAARVDQAGLTPPLELGIDVENALGSGEFSGIDSAEITLSLASVLERSAKRAGRRSVAEHSLSALSTERDAIRLDLLAEVARRYLEVVATRQRIAIAGDDVELRERIAEAATQRIRVGASPPSVRLIAEAQGKRAAIAQQRAESDLAAAWRHLAVLWGRTDDPAVPELAGDVLALPEVASLDGLLASLDAIPALRRLNDTARLRAAELELARAQIEPDVLWRVGVRRLEAADDWALVAGAAIPFGTARRAQPAIAVASSDLAVLDAERAATRLELESTLIRAHGRYAAARSEVEAITQTLMPQLEAATTAAEKAYRAGAASFLEWAEVLSEITAARLARLDAAVEAQRALIEIQRLTGTSFVVAGGSGETRR